MIFDSNHSYNISSESNKISPTVLSSSPSPEPVQTSSGTHKILETPSLKITSSGIGNDISNIKKNTDQASAFLNGSNQNLSNDNNYNQVTKLRNRSHPNIHHHPTIHPHNHYQRMKIPVNFKETSDTDSEKKISTAVNHSSDKVNSEITGFSQKPNDLNIFDLNTVI